jgi:hypothetical protein
MPMLILLQVGMEIYVYQKKKQPEKAAKRKLLEDHYTTDLPIKEEENKCLLRDLRDSTRNSNAADSNMS